MRHTWRYVAVAGLLAMLMVGCASAVEPEATPTSPTAETPMDEEEHNADVTETPEPEDGDMTEPETTTPATPRPTRELPPNVEPIPTTGPSQGGAISEDVPTGLIEEMIVDLSGKAEVRTDAIDVVQAESVVWNDGSLGCPEPGMFYTQMLVNGYRVILRVDGREYDYHANDNGYFFLCQQASGSAPSGRVTPLGGESIPEPPTSAPEK